MFWLLRTLYKFEERFPTAFCNLKGPRSSRSLAVAPKSNKPLISFLWRTTIKTYGAGRRTQLLNWADRLYAHCALLAILRTFLLWNPSGSTPSRWRKLLLFLDRRHSSKTNNIALGSFSTFPEGPNIWLHSDCEKANILWLQPANCAMQKGVE